MKKIITICTIAVAFVVGACSPIKSVIAEQTKPLKIWLQNENGDYSTFYVVDENTGVNYVVVSAEASYGDRSKSIAITPRLNADGSLYVRR